MATRRILTLPEGRRIGFRVYGDPRGFVVLNCHGGLMSGRDVELSDAAARERGIALVSPDRPGIGRSDRRPGHRMLDWARDDAPAVLAELVQLGLGGRSTVAGEIARFGVMGWSEGGQYALAVAHEHPDRVVRAAIVAGALPLDDPATFAALNRTDRRLALLARRTPRLARLVFATTRALTGILPPALPAWFSGLALDGNDAEVLRENARWFSRAVHEGAANPWGGVDEYHAFVAPWGFAPEAVRVPVTLHQGSDDRLVPAAWAWRLAARLPDAVVRPHPGEGHFIVVNRRHPILDDFARFA